MSRSIQKQEISQLISSIKSLEHCIQPFLDEIDQNKDDIISENEWGHALDLSAGKFIDQFLLIDPIVNFLFIFRRHGDFERVLLS